MSQAISCNDGEQSLDRRRARMSQESKKKKKECMQLYRGLVREPSAARGPPAMSTYGMSIKNFLFSPLRLPNETTKEA